MLEAMARAGTIWVLEAVAITGTTGMLRGGGLPGAVLQGVPRPRTGAMPWSSGASCWPSYCSR